ncbi:MAG: 50S ribosomal protein L21 [Candidatus Omnitrophica bacterium]|nr:50S ribosomal protein L21 [Candidatus Omnitrophota bacterium]
MFAVVQIGSSQFKVSEGDIIKAHRIAEDAGKDLTFDQVLVFAKGDDVRIGQPFLKDVKIKAKVMDHVSADKVIAFKYRIRKNSAKKIGHRQKLTTLSITQISA